MNRFASVIQLKPFTFQTVFELNPNQKSIQLQVMKNKRKAHGGMIEKFQKDLQQVENENLLIAAEHVSDTMSHMFVRVFINY